MEIKTRAFISAEYHYLAGNTDFDDHIFEIQKYEVSTYLSDDVLYFRLFENEFYHASCNDEHDIILKDKVIHASMIGLLETQLKELCEEKAKLALISFIKFNTYQEIENNVEVEFENF